MRFKINEQLFTRGVLLSNHSFYRFDRNGFQEISEEVFLKIAFPILIVGKEHCQQERKRFPITNKKDLQQIVDTQLSDAQMVMPADIGADDSEIRAWRLDEKAKQVVESRFLFWCPEEEILSLSEFEALFDVRRAGRHMWLTNWQNGLHLAEQSGLLLKPELFLLSVGAPTDKHIQTINDKEYVSLISECFNKADTSALLTLLVAQSYPRKLTKNVNWPSLLTGIAAGALLFNLLYLGLVNWQLSSVEAKVKQQDVGTVIALQNKQADALALVESMQSAVSGNNLLRNSLPLLTTLMENGIEILRVESEGEILSIRMQTELATDALSLIAKLSEVEKAEFSTPVVKSVGDERFTVAVTFKGDDISE